MSLIAVPSLSPEQIASEIAEMRKAAGEIRASRTKSVAFLREVGVLNGKTRNGGSKKKLDRRK